MEDKRGVPITEKSVLGDYSKPEDKVTAALLQILHYGGHDLVQYLFEECDLPSNTINVMSQIYENDSHPDGAISCDCKYQIYIESKIVSNAINKKQLENHRKLIDSNNLLLYITPDAITPSILDGLYNVFWFNWEDLIEKLQSYDLSDRLLKFLIDQLILLVKHLVYDKIKDNIKAKKQKKDKIIATEMKDKEERVIIVGGRWGEDVALKYYFYACQPNRHFLPARYIAFYWNGRIKYLFEIEGDPKEAVDIKKESSINKDYFSKKEPNYKSEPRKFFKLKYVQDFTPEILNNIKSIGNKPCAFVRRQRYTTIDKLRLAQFTSQL